MGSFHPMMGPLFAQNDARHQLSAASVHRRHELARSAAAFLLTYRHVTLYLYLREPPPSPSGSSGCSAPALNLSTTMVSPSSDLNIQQLDRQLSSKAVNDHGSPRSNMQWTQVAALSGLLPPPPPGRRIIGGFLIRFGRIVFSRIKRSRDRRPGASRILRAPSDNG